MDIGAGDRMVSRGCDGGWRRTEALDKERLDVGKGSKQREMEQLGKGFRVPLADGGMGRRPAGVDWLGGLPWQLGGRKNRGRTGVAE